MADEFKIRWFNTSGVLQYETVDYLDLYYQKIVNRPGLAVISYAGDHGLASAIGDKWTAEIWRRNPQIGIDWYVEFDCIFRTGQWLGRAPGIFYAYCFGQLHRLEWRHVLWYAGVTNRSAFVSKKAETVMKTLVDYNAGSNATTGNGRLRAGAMSEITVQTDGANGSTVSHYCAYEQLLRSLQRLAPIAGGDFDLVKTAATTYQFRWYTGQLGTDRTSTVIFAESRATMANTRYVVNHRQEKTVALVGGPNEGTSRETAIRTGDDYNATTNNIETFVDARNIKPGDTSGLNSAGDRELNDLMVEESLAFDVLQTPACYYGEHYFLGDLVKVVNPFTGTGETKKVYEVAWTVRQAVAPTIQVYLDNA